MAFTIDGGVYKDISYSCMYENYEKYRDVSVDNERYYMFGVVEGPEPKQAILVFNANTDKLIFAKEIELIGDESQIQTQWLDLISQIENEMINKIKSRG